MILVLMGAPGAGKGTQGELLEKNHNFIKISTGDLLRDEIKQETPLGLEVKEIIDRGDFVNDDIMLSLIKKKLHNFQDSNLILDGYPRTLDQAKALHNLEESKSIIGVIKLDIDDNKLLSRLTGRLVCSSCSLVYHRMHKQPKLEGLCDVCSSKLISRNDDEVEKIKHRLEVYHNKTLAVLNFYREKSLLHEVDGCGDALSVNEKIVNKLSEIKTQSCS